MTFPAMSPSPNSFRSSAKLLFCPLRLSKLLLNNIPADPVEFALVSSLARPPLLPGGAGPLSVTVLCALVFNSTLHGFRVNEVDLAVPAECNQERPELVSL